jgi:hypothetical protein
MRRFAEHEGRGMVRGRRAKATTGLALLLQPVAHRLLASLQRQGEFRRARHRARVAVHRRAEVVEQQPVPLPQFSQQKPLRVGALHSLQAPTLGA